LLVTSYNSTNASSPRNDEADTFFEIAPGFQAATGSQTVRDWICSTQDLKHGHCDLKESASSVSSWIFKQWDVQYCFSQQVAEHCKLQFSSAIMIFVILCNFVKLVCMAWIARKRDSEPLITVGDAIASFLDDPDQMTQNACLAGKDDFQKTECSGRQPVEIQVPSVIQYEMVPPPESEHPWDVDPIGWAPKRRFWFSAASVERWLICNSL